MHKIKIQSEIKIFKEFSMDFFFKEDWQKNLEQTKESEDRQSQIKDVSLAGKLG